jgi:FixJ family two-component response regulator
MADGATVHVVDDDPALLRSLSRLLAAAGYATATHDCPQRFIDGFDPAGAGCVVLDRRMPGVDGHAVLTWLTEKRACVPVIFLTAAGDIASSVAAMKGGAVDYLTKPVEADALLAAIERALAVDRARRATQAEAAAHAERLGSLTCREREVLDAAVAGRLNKQIAGDLDIVEKTVKVHRARVMKKMGARTFADLVTMVVRHREDS